MSENTQAYRIVIAEDEPIMKMDMKELLIGCGYDVVGEAADGFDAVEICRSLKPDVVLLDIKMPLMDGLSAAKIISEEELADTIMLVTAYSDRAFIENAKKIGVSGYLVKPVEERNIVPAIELAVERTTELKRLRKDVKQANERLEKRIVIEKAKGVLMRSRNMSEQDAYDFLRKISQMKNISIARVAEMVLKQSEG